jgi:hypothetical protein
MTTTLTGTSIEIADGSIPGRALAAVLDLATSQLAQRTFMAYPVPFTSCRVWDAMHTMVVGSAAADDIALITGTPGTHAPKLSGGDCKASTTSRKVAFELDVPANYDDGETFQIRIRAGMETTVSDTTATVDLQVWKPSGTGTVGSDLCTTAAQSINSLTAADKDFTIDASAIDPGDKLICVVTLAVTDGATATAVTPAIYAITRRCDTRG